MVFQIFAHDPHYGFGQTFGISCEIGSITQNILMSATQFVQLYKSCTIDLFHGVAILILLHSDSLYTKLRLDEIIVWCHVCSMIAFITVMETGDMTKMVTA